MTLDTSFVCHYSSGPSIAPACATAGNTGTIAPPGATSPAAATGGSRRGGRHSDVRVALGCVSGTDLARGSTTKTVRSSFCCSYASVPLYKTHPLGMVLEA